MSKITIANVNMQDARSILSMIGDLTALADENEKKADEWDGTKRVKSDATDK